ncbi:DUF6946 family protein [Lentisalinibacter salinarum]|uniref:DUF6946 family protein n=1 Tax=Lentisalinibacter salinarum TaxID=2992239 RepID=UPI00386DF82B
MNILDGSGRQIATMDEWASLYDTPRQRRHWKEHRSAYSVADFVLNRDGAGHIGRRVEGLLGESVTLERIIPEFEQRFDEYGRGRVHDLGIFGSTADGRKLFIGVEAKVDESFGPRVQEAYLQARAKQIIGQATKAPERIEGLLKQHFQEPDLAMFDVRYQLLYGTVGTLAAGADISVFFVAVFRTPLYDESIGADNYRDYVHFMQRIQAEPLPVADKGALAHQASIDGKRLYCVHESFDLF